jgi:hypothetical protein
MSEIKHTPGPWLIERHRTFINAIGPISAEEYAGCSWLEVSEKDASLIAAAPELLEALIQIRASYARLKPAGYPDSDSEKLADAAIAKAGA